MLLRRLIVEVKTLIRVVIKQIRLQNFFLLLDIELKEAGSSPTIVVIIPDWLSTGISVLRRVSLGSGSTLGTVPVAVIRLLLHVHTRCVVTSLETIEFESSFVLAVCLSVSLVLVLLYRLVLVLVVTLRRCRSVIIEVKGCRLLRMSGIGWDGLGLICVYWLVLVIIISEDFVLGGCHCVPARRGSHVLRLGSRASDRVALRHSWRTSRHRLHRVSGPRITTRWIVEVE